MKLPNAISAMQKSPAPCGGRIARLLKLGAAALLPWAAGSSRADNHVDYRFEHYLEENGRIEVNTHSAAFEQKLIEAVTARGEIVYDSISGATPTGAAPLPGQTAVPTTPMHDVRRGGNLAFDVHLGRHTLSPEVAYSRESDYISTGVSLGDAIEFNHKNTTLQFGVSHDFDDVLDNSPVRQSRHKDTTDGLIGISQLLSPNTIFAADFTYGVESGYLDDPYKSMSFSGWTPFFGFPLPLAGSERRPDHRDRQVLLFSLTHFFTKLNGSGEISYRFCHDSFGVVSHTATVNWHQHLGKYFILEPLFRFYEQSAADFYTLSVPGYSLNDGQSALRPAYFSADYRLSRMMSFTYGIQGSVVIRDWLMVDLGYQRYEIFGLDSETAASTYPKADIITLGLRLLF